MLNNLLKNSLSCELAKFRTIPRSLTIYFTRIRYIQINQIYLGDFEEKWQFWTNHDIKVTRTVKLHMDDDIQPTLIAIRIDPVDEVNTIKSICMIEEMLIADFQLVSLERFLRDLSHEDVSFFRLVFFRLEFMHQHIGTRQ